MSCSKATEGLRWRETRTGRWRLMRGKTTVVVVYPINPHRMNWGMIGYRKGQADYSPGGASDLLTQQQQAEEWARATYTENNHE